MSVPVRPAKPVGGGGGTSYTAGSDLYANELNEDIDPLYAALAGGLDNTNMAALAAIDGSKLANAPAGIPAGKYNAGSIVNADIANATLQKGKHSTTIGEKLTQAQLETVLQEVAFSTVIGGPGTLASVSVSRTTNAGNYETKIQWALVSGTGAAITVVPTTALAISIKDIIGLYLADVTYVSGTGTLSGKVVIISISKT